MANRWLRALLLGLVGMVCGAARAELPPMQLQQVSASVWFVQGQSALGSSANQNFISNAGVIVTQTGVVLVDALGSPALATRLVAEIKKITPLPITHVLVTHYHADHIYGLQVFQALGARILAHRAAQIYLNSETARSRLAYSRSEMAPWIDDKTRLVHADEWLDGDRDLLLGGTRIQVRALGPAHTPEDLVVYLPQDKVLFAGDLVFRGRIPFVGQADSRRWITALETLLAFDSRAIVPGHGPLSDQARQDLQLTRSYLVYLRAVMGKASQNMEPFDEAYKNVDWSAFAQVPMFGIANRVNAYNTYLLLEQESKP